MPTLITDDILDEVISGDSETYTIPPGEWILSVEKYFRIVRHTLRELICTGSTFYPAEDQPFPFFIYGGSGENYAYGRRVGIATLDDENIDRLEMQNVSGIEVGDVLLMRWGINLSDLQEGKANGFRTVAAIEGNLVIFEEPFGIVCPVYGSYQELFDASDGSPNADEKIGPYGLCQITPYAGQTEHYGVLNWHGANNTGLWQRDDGTKHDVWVFDEHQPLSDLIIRDANIVCLDNPVITYGNWQLSASFAQRISFLNCTIHNPTGSGCHLFQGSNCLIDGLTFTGTGKSTPFGGVYQFPASLISWWGGEYNVFKNINSTANNIRLASGESGPRSVVVENVDIVSQNTIVFAGELQHFGMLGKELGDPGVEFRNVKLNVPPANSSVFTINSIAFTLNDMNIVTEAMPDFFHLYNKDYKSSFKWFNTVFGPEEEFDWELTLDGATTFFRITEFAGRGLFKEVTLVLDSRDGWSGIGLPGWGDIFADSEGLEIPFPIGSTTPWRSIAMTHTLADYYDTISIDFSKSAGADRTVRFTGIYLPVRTETLGLAATPGMGYRRSISGFTQQRV